MNRRIFIKLMIGAGAFGLARALGLKIDGAPVARELPAPMLLKGEIGIIEGVRIIEHGGYLIPQDLQDEINRLHNMRLDNTKLFFKLRR